jgi:hypothetical protein
MLARQLLIGVMALATFPRPIAQEAEPIFWRYLLHENHVSDEIADLSVFEQVVATGLPAMKSVELDGDVHQSRNLKPLSAMRIQVWLLRTDGTALAQSQAPVSIGSATGVNTMRFTFAPVPAKEVAGVVVSEDGTLFVRAIKGNPAS